MGAHQRVLPSCRFRKVLASLRSCSQTLFHHQVGKTNAKGNLHPWLALRRQGTGLRHLNRQTSFQRRSVRMPSIRATVVRVAQRRIESASHRLLLCLRRQFPSQSGLTKDAARCRHARPRPLGFAAVRCGRGGRETERRSEQNTHQ